MKYCVSITEEALTQAYQFLHYIAEEQRSPLTAQRWWDKALQKIATLETFPRRCPVAPDALLLPRMSGAKTNYGF